MFSTINRWSDMRLGFIWMFCFLAFLGCTPKPATLVRTQYSPETEDVTRIVITYARELEEKYGLFLYDSRVLFDDKINKVRIDFTSQKSIMLCEAREWLVDVVEGYVHQFREDSILRTKFHNRPISYEDLEIHITFESYFNRYVDPTYTAYIILENGWSYFYGSELNIAYTDLWMQKVEPYFKTRQFVYYSREAEIPYEEAKEQEKRDKLLSDERVY